MNATAVDGLVILVGDPPGLLAILNPDQARDLAELLEDKAVEAELQQTAVDLLDDQVGEITTNNTEGNQ